MIATCRKHGFYELQTQFISYFFQAFTGPFGRYLSKVGSYHSYEKTKSEEGRRRREGGGGMG